MADVEVKPDAQATPDATVLTKPAADPKAPAAGTPPADGAKPAEGTKEGEKQTGAPEKYADFKLPEGITIEDQGRFEKFTALAKGLNLSQESAQKLIDLAIENGKSADAAKAAESAKVKAEWTAALKSDPEIGGQNFEATVQYAKRAMKEFANDKFIEFLNDTGFGDNPEMVRVFARIGKKMGEDKFVEGKPSGTPDGKSAAEVIYGK